ADALLAHVRAGPEAGQEPLVVAQDRAGQSDEPAIKRGDAEDAGAVDELVPSLFHIHEVRCWRRRVVTDGQRGKRFNEELGRFAVLPRPERAVLDAGSGYVFLARVFVVFA